MGVIENDMLRQLGSGVLPVDGVRTAAPIASNGSRSAFAALLGQAEAQAGMQGASFDSGLPVRVAGGADLGLSEAQLARMGSVIDKLHASGASHALLSIDGRFFKVDVLTRQIRAEFDPAGGGQLDGIDAVASVPSMNESAAGLLGPPPASSWNESLLKALGPRGSDRSVA